MEIKEIVYLPEAEVELTKEDVDALWKAAESHYDARCRSVIEEPGVVQVYIFKKWPEQGLLRGARNSLEGEPAKTVVRLDMRDLDTLCKIAESPIMPIAQRLGLNELRNRLTGEYRRLNGDT